MLLAVAISRLVHEYPSRNQVDSLLLVANISSNRCCEDVVVIELEIGGEA